LAFEFTFPFDYTYSSGASFFTRKPFMKKIVVASLFMALTLPAYADEGTKPEAKTFRVPYRLTNTNHVLLRAKINGKGPYNFIVDTGAPALFVTTGVAKKLGVAADKEGWGKFERFEIEGGVVLKDFKGRIENPFQLEGMNGLGLAGAELHGIIGYTLLARYRLEFDFTKHKMGWTPLDFKPPQPVGLGGRGAAPGGLDAMASVMKILGAFMGKKPEQEIRLRGFLGFRLEKNGDHIVVTAVLAKSPAADAGLKVGDRITKFQGRSIDSVDSVHRAATTLRANESAKLEVKRDGEDQTIVIKSARGL
jgi:serine protease DegQ